MTSQLQTAEPLQPKPRHQHTLRLVAGCVAIWMLISMSLTFAPRATEARSAVSAPVNPLPAVTAGGDHLGVAYANYQISNSSAYFTPLAAAAGARWDRVDFAWSRIEAQKGAFDFRGYDDLVNRDQDHGLGIIGILQLTPDWAAKCDPAAAAVARASSIPDPPFLPLRTAELAAHTKCPPKNLYLAWDDPNNYWGHYVRTTVARYRDRVHVWEIWNEPDLGDVFWTGSVADYAQLLKVGYQAIKAEDPSATVLFAGLAYWANPNYYVAVLDQLKTMPGAAQHNYYFDVMSLHLYSSVYTIRPVAASIQKAMTERVGPRPIWLTEAGVPLWDEPFPIDEPYRQYHATAEEAANYVIQAFAQARAAKIDKFIFFRTHDNNLADGPSPFGLIRDNATYRPAYVAYQVAASYLHGENQVTVPAISAGVQRITFWGTPRGRIDVLWNVTGSTLEHMYPTLLPEVTVVTKRGVATTLSSTGSITLPLEGATANTGDGGSFMIGGSPVLVIHADTVPPTSHLQTLPPISYGREVTLTWTVEDTAGPNKPGTGHWYTDIERAPSAGGPWTPALGLPHTQQTSTAVVTVPTGGLWYFRARARDRAGNWETWHPGAQTQTTVILTRTVEISVETYIDANSNGVRDPGEEPAPSTTLTWTSAGGALINQHSGSTWVIQATVEAGDYLITARAPDHLPAVYRFTVTAGPEPRQITAKLGLKPIRAVLIMPLIFKQF
jgi:hypothetical protein